MRQSVFLQQEALKSQSDEDWRAYKAAQNRVRLQISEVKREFVNEATNQAHASPKNMWERINLYRQSNPNENFTLGIRRRERQLHILSKLPVLSKLRAKSATFSQILVRYLLRNLRTLNHL